jgi:hypothetical protein
MEHLVLYGGHPSMTDFNSAPVVSALKKVDATVPTELRVLSPCSIEKVKHTIVFPKRGD